MLPSLASLPAGAPAAVGVHTRQRVRKDEAERRGGLVEDPDLLDATLEALTRPPFAFAELSKALLLCGVSLQMRRQCFDMRWKPLCAAMGWKEPTGPAEAIAMIRTYHALWLYTAALPDESFAILVGTRSLNAVDFDGAIIAVRLRVDIQFVVPPGNPPLDTFWFGPPADHPQVLQVDARHTSLSQFMMPVSVSLLGIPHNAVMGGIPEQPRVGVPTRGITVWLDDLQWAPPPTILGVHAVQGVTEPSPFGFGQSQKNGVSFTYAFTHAVLEAQRERAGGA
jgi:hypothetical protein